MAFPRFNQSKSNRMVQRPEQLGTTFSQLQCAYMGLDFRDAFQQICELGFNRIRLCSYWNEIEPVEGQFNFSTLDWLLDTCDRYNIEVVLAVGMKVPRWPEFHFPDWLQARHNTGGRPDPIDWDKPLADQALQFVEQVIQHVRHAPAIKYWQVENEPFTRLDITGGRFLSYEFVRQEVGLTRSLAIADQKVLLTNAITLPAAQLDEDDHAFAESLTQADAVGINVYTKVPAGTSRFYLQPMPPYWRKLQQWQAQLKEQGRESWIAEAQAEPWEPNQLVAMNRVNYPSSSPKQAINLVQFLSDLGFDTVMLWGCEYWYWHKKNGRSDWWSAMEQLIRA